MNEEEEKRKIEISRQHRVELGRKIMSSLNSMW